MKDLDIVHKDEYFLMPADDGRPTVSRIAAEHWGRHFGIDRKSPANAFIAFIQKGSAQLTFPDSSIEVVSPGQVMVLPPNTRHYLSAGDEGAVLIVVVLTGDLAFDLVSTYLPATPMGMALSDPGRVESLFYRLLEVGEKKGIHTSQIASALVEPLLLTIDQEFRSHSESDNATYPVFTRCRNFIENNWKDIESVRTVPQAMGISQPYMGRLFKHYEGCTPHQFLLQQKMNYALYELQNSDTRISEIAYDLGFADAYSFSKTFKRILKVSPSRMRVLGLQ